MSFTKGQVAQLAGAALPATGLLALDQSHFVRYLKRSVGNNGGFYIVGFAGVERLSRGERDELAQRSRAAASQLENATFTIDDLLARLTRVADGQDTASPDHAQSRPLSASSDLTDSTPPPIVVRALETSSYHGRLEIGGRPPCSIEELLHIPADHRTRYEAIRSSLIDDLVSEGGLA
ncbi:MAG: hypothetical protein M1817_003903 [Caeruleum heppii]|nr:MAG: hypothetical protein M1817_003903 [Caeruleum heppii]